MKGGEVTPIIAIKIMLYTYCTAFHINPVDAYNTPVSIIKEMLSIHGEVKRLESQEFDKIKRG